MNRPPFPKSTQNHFLAYIPFPKESTEIAGAHQLGSMARTHKEFGRLLLVPLPFQGHISPMLQLATLLHRRGFSITVIHPCFNSPKASNFPDFHFVPIHDGIEREQPSDIGDLASFLNALNENCVVPFTGCVKRLLEEEGRSIRCIVSDVHMHFTQNVASSLNLPRLALRTGSLTSYVHFFDFLLNCRSPLIQDCNTGKDTNDVLLTMVEAANAKHEVYELVENIVKISKASRGIIWNSFEELEEESLAKVREELKIPIFPVGPLHKTSVTSSSSLFVQDRSCMDWLDKQAPNSVIYVSFGSVASIGKEQLVEMAWGLAHSKQPFLWVVRRGSSWSGEVELPNGFLEETKDRGMVIEWAPQVEVLAHQAVGGFWTHCGWNSTLESIREGVPLLCWPCFGDQQWNARDISRVWKVGMELENGLERGEIEKAVRKLMVEEEGKEMRERIKVLKESAEQSLRERGSSYQNLDKVVELIQAL